VTQLGPVRAGPRVLGTAAADPWGRAAASRGYRVGGLQVLVRTCLGSRKEKLQADECFVANAGVRHW